MMIFVTVGTHEQPFNRLLKAIDDYALEKGFAKSQIIVQKGFSKYTLNHVTSKEMYSAVEMDSFYNQADLIVSHGGPGSMFPAWLLGKPVIAVPRQKQFKEHVDDHQVEFCEFIEEKGKVICVKDIGNLSMAIEKAMLNAKRAEHQSKTSIFIQRFEKELFLMNQK